MKYPRLSIIFVVSATVIVAGLAAISTIAQTPHQHAGVTVASTEIITHHDTIPRFYGLSQNRVNSVNSGNWNDPKIWSTGQVPGASDCASIEAGHTVTLNLAFAQVDCAEVSGKLSFAQNSKLRVANILIMPDAELEMGTAGSPITATLEITDKAVNTGG